MPFPPAHILIGVGAAELVRSRRLAWPLVWSAGAVIALMPDMDVALRAGTGAWGPVDRSFAHSLLGIATVGGVAGAVAGWRWSLVAAAAYGSHLVADLLQTQKSTSVALFWPLQERGMAPLAGLFPHAPVERGGGMRQAALSLLEPAALGPLALETLVVRCGG